MQLKWSVSSLEVFKKLNISIKFTLLFRWMLLSSLSCPELRWLMRQAPACSVHIAVWDHKLCYTRVSLEAPCCHCFLHFYAPPSLCRTISATAIICIKCVQLWYCTSCRTLLWFPQQNTLKVSLFLLLIVRIITPRRAHGTVVEEGKQHSPSTPPTFLGVLWTKELLVFLMNKRLNGLYEFRSKWACACCVYRLAGSFGAPRNQLFTDQWFFGGQLYILTFMCLCLKVLEPTVWNCPFKLRQI